MYLAVLLPSIFALFALYKKKLTIGGILLAWTLGIIITLFGGTYAFIALALTFLLTIFSDKLKKKDVDERRTAYQIISNVLTSALCIILYYYTKANMFYIMYYCVLGSSLSDTLASSIGSLSRKKPINILTLKKMTAGESGAISFLGLNASIFGGIIIGLVYYSVQYDVVSYLLIILMSTLGSIIDSLLGLTLQSKYVCPKCQKRVETKTHCGERTKKIKGLDFVNNDVVNLLNNVIVFILSYIFLL